MPTKTDPRTFIAATDDCPECNGSARPVQPCEVCGGGFESDPDAPTAQERHDARREAVTQERRDDFEEETGLTFDPEGPEPSPCECGELVQFNADHECGYTRSLNAEAAHYEEAMHGNY